MPIITCDIRRGRSEEQRRALAKGLTEAVQQAVGCPVECVFLVMREMPGFNFVDGGEHVPEYVPGPEGKDLAGHELIAKREGRVKA
jgi:4-oxalocrotonate tautomerase family enzyme